MKKFTIIQLYLLIFLFAFPIILTSCKKDTDDDTEIPIVPPAPTTVTDVEGNVYKIVTIGNQVWMAENLKTTKLKDGTVLLNLSEFSWSTCPTTAGIGWYEDNAAHKTTYGCLYNWGAVNTEKLCPEGWRMPTDSDWSTLKSNTGGEIAGGKLKETGTTHWVSPNTGATDEYGFKMLPGGFNNGIAYIGLGTAVYFWTATQASEEYAYYFYANAYDAMFSKYQAEKKYAMSVRCIKN